MSGIVLETTEFAYLLATIHAKTVIGVEDPALFPATPEAQDATYKVGLERLKAHGWLKPLENNQFHLSDTLLLMVATIADPQVAIISACETPTGGAKVLTHYLTDADIVELVRTGAEEYTLGVVPDRATLYGRIAQLADVSAESAESGEVVLETAQFDQLQALATGGQTEQATKLLKEVGLNGQSAALVNALAAPSCQVVVVRAQLGQVEAGRRVQVFHSPAGAWVAQRTSQDTTTLKVEAVEAAKLAEVLEGHVMTLAAAGKAGGQAAPAEAAPSE